MSPLWERAAHYSIRVGPRAAACRDFVAKSRSVRAISRPHEAAIRPMSPRAGLDLAAFDFGVNSGPAESVKTLQGLVGVTQDGSVGPITLAAVRQFNVGDLIGRFAQARLAFDQSLNMPEFEQGWATRVAQIQTAATKRLDASQVAVA